MIFSCLIFPSFAVFGRKMNVSTEEDIQPDGSESSSATNADVNGIQRESKLELFGFDSLVNILGLRRCIVSPFVSFFSVLFSSIPVILSLELHSVNNRMSFFKVYFTV